MPYQVENVPSDQPGLKEDKSKDSIYFCEKPCFFTKTIILFFNGYGENY